MASVLIIDDEKAIRDLLCQVLEQAGHGAVTAANAQEGLHLYRQQPVDVVLTDIFMPETDGFELIASLKRENPFVKIIVMTGIGASPKLLHVTELLGAHTTLYKPFTIQHLLSTIHLTLSPHPSS